MYPSLALFLYLAADCTFADHGFNVTKSSENDLFQTEIFWRNIDSKDVLGSLCGIAPAGFQEYTGGSSLVQYVCRARHEDRWIPGKLVYLSRGELICYIPKNGEHAYSVKHENANKIQILNAPAGWTSWVSIPSLSPLSYITGGFHSGGAPSPICRFTDVTGHVHLGKFQIDSSECYYPHGGENKQSQNIEVLVLNALGRKLLNI